MPSYSKAIILGNLTRDPELRVTPKGTAICQFTLAVNRDWKDESGQKREKVSFIDCEAWNKTAETIAKYCAKGRALLVDGRIEQDTWDDKQTGQKRSKLKIVVESFTFVGSGQREGGAGGSDSGEDPGAYVPPAGERQSNPPGRPGGAPAPRNDIHDEDVPF